MPLEVFALQDALHLQPPPEKVLGVGLGYGMRLETWIACKSGITPV